MIKALIFDLGGTLIEYAGPYATWPALETPGFKAAYAFLAQQGARLPAFETFRDTGFEMLPGRWQMAIRGEKNLRLVDLLTDVLAVCRVGGVASEAVADAAELYQRAICDQARPLPGAQETLAYAKSQGYKIGLLSNTMFTGAAHIDDLERFGLADYFDALLFSADVDKWKPNPDPFWHVLDELGAEAETAVFIGDDPANDLVGAQQVGMQAIYMRSSERFVMPPGLKPCAEISRLEELPGVLAKPQNILEN